MQCARVLIAKYLGCDSGSLGAMVTSLMVWATSDVTSRRFVSEHSRTIHKQRHKGSAWARLVHSLISLRSINLVSTIPYTHKCAAPIPPIHRRAASAFVAADRATNPSHYTTRRPHAWFNIRHWTQRQTIALAFVSAGTNPLRTPLRALALDFSRHPIYLPSPATVVWTVPDGKFRLAFWWIFDGCVITGT